MTKTIVALYDHRSEAETASRDLQAAGFESSAIEILSHGDLSGRGWSGSGITDTTTVAPGTLTGDSSIGAASGMARTDLSTGYVASPNTVPGSGAGLETGTGLGGTTATGTNSGGMLTRLAGWGIPNQDAQVYAEGVRRGGSLLKLRLDEEDVDRAMEVLERGNVVDVEERGSAYRSSGWAGYDETADYYDDQSADEERLRYSPGRTPIDTGVSATSTGTASAGLTGAAAAMRDVNADSTRTTRTGTAEREEQIPLVEEQVTVGKRSVERGGVRVRSYVVETPVEEQVRLRDETVTVERRPGGLASNGLEGSAEVPADAFRERTIEVTETDEEAVISKTAHVRETVVVRKDVEERAQSVRDTVRRTEVEIEDTRDENLRDRRTDRSDDVTR
ncbi:YsnF/AvaK domain-containing protein [Azospirillum sp. YIM B02556]|uniref:YsnF/AvaK domain-containing protein n=1 Tax=Azospirillum endophyticum TaxID=2800326 RepID=A0ABS1FCW5_9PROT|nr:YsnF/AvaK domain-containing protein [Azospirillum endophyticum]MBK1841269.1 YsnF/AvaK domain-containing protein [Azospirillum endophyticum]